MSRSGALDNVLYRCPSLHPNGGDSVLQERENHMKNLSDLPVGVQYYRQPTPLPDEWDGDLAAMSDAIRKNVTEDLGVVEAGDWLELNEVLLASRTGAEWHHWLVIAALAVLVGEKLMERRFV